MPYLNVDGQPVHYRDKANLYPTQRAVLEQVMSDAFRQTAIDLSCDDLLDQAATLLPQYLDATRAAAPVQAAYQRVEAAHRRSDVGAMEERCMALVEALEVAEGEGEAGQGGAAQLALLGGGELPTAVRNALEL